MIREFLKQQQLEHWAGAFEKEEVDLETLASLKDEGSVRAFVEDLSVEMYLGDVLGENSDEDHLTALLTKYGLQSLQLKFKEEKIDTDSLWALQNDEVALAQTMDTLKLKIGQKPKFKKLVAEMRKEDGDDGDKREKDKSALIKAILSLNPPSRETELGTMSDEASTQDVQFQSVTVDHLQDAPKEEMPIAVPSPSTLATITPRSAPVTSTVASDAPDWSMADAAEVPLDPCTKESIQGSLCKDNSNEVCALMKQTMTSNALLRALLQQTLESDMLLYMNQLEEIRVEVQDEQVITEKVMCMDSTMDIFEVVAQHQVLTQNPQMRKELIKTGKFADNRNDAIWHEKLMLKWIFFVRARSESTCFEEGQESARLQLIADIVERAIIISVLDDPESRRIFYPQETESKQDPIEIATDDSSCTYRLLFSYKMTTKTLNEEKMRAIVAKKPAINQMPVWLKTFVNCDLNAFLKCNENALVEDTAEINDRISMLTGVSDAKQNFLSMQNEETLEALHAQAMRLEHENVLFFKQWFRTAQEEPGMQEFCKKINEQVLAAAGSTQEILERRSAQASEQLLLPIELQFKFQEEDSCAVDDPNKVLDAEPMTLQEVSDMSGGKIEQMGGRDFVQSLIDMGLHKAAIRLLMVPDAELSSEESLEAILSCIAAGAEATRKATKKRVVALIGNTGVGKSSTVNFLKGCKMSSTAGKLGKKFLQAVGAVVRMGHANVSMTLMPDVVEGEVVSGSERMTFMDTAGYEDTRGWQMACANAVNVRSALHAVDSVRVLILVEFGQFTVNRSIGIQQLVTSVTDFFGSIDETLKNAQSIAVGITKAPRGTEDARTLINELLEEAFTEDPTVPGSSILSHLKGALFLVDPLQELQHAPTDEEILGRLASLQPIQRSNINFQTVLSPEIEKELGLLCQPFMLRIKTHLTAGRFELVKMDVLKLYQLKQLKHEKVDELLTAVKETVTKYFADLATGNIKLMKMINNLDENESLLHELKQAAQLLTKAVVLDACFPDGVNGRSLQVLRDEYCTEIFNLELAVCKTKDMAIVDAVKQANEKLRHDLMEDEELHLSDKRIEEIVEKCSGCSLEAGISTAVCCEPKAIDLTMVKHGFESFHTEIRFRPTRFLTCFCKDINHLRHLLQQAKKDLRKVFLNAMHDLEVERQRKKFNDLLMEANTHFVNIIKTHGHVKVLDEFDEYEQNEDAESLINALFPKHYRLLDTATYLWENDPSRQDARMEQLDSQLQGLKTQAHMRKLAREEEITKNEMKDVMTNNSTSLHVMSQSAELIHETFAQLQTMDAALADTVRCQFMDNLRKSCNVEVLRGHYEGKKFKEVLAVLSQAAQCCKRFKKLGEEDEAMSSCSEEEVDEMVLPLEEELQKLFSQTCETAIKSMEENIKNSTLELGNLTHYGNATRALQGPIFERLLRQRTEETQTILWEHVSRFWDDVKDVKRNLCAGDWSRTARRLVRCRKLCIVTQEAYSSGQLQIFDDNVNSMLESNSEGSGEHIWLLGNELRKLTERGKYQAYQETAAQIISAFPQFTSLNRELFNKAAGSKSFKDCLAELEGIVFDEQGEEQKSDILEKERCCLLAACKEFEITYSSFIDKLRRCKTSQEGEDLATAEVHQCRSAAKRIPKRPMYTGKEGMIGTLLGHICAVWTFLESGDVYLRQGGNRQLKQVHGAQVLSVMRLLSIGKTEASNHICEVGTGEGKSVSLGISAAFFSLIGVADVYVVSYSNYLAERDKAEFERLFQRLEINPHYGDATDLSEYIIDKQLPDLSWNVKKLCRAEPPCMDEVEKAGNWWTPAAALARQYQKWKDKDELKSVLLIDEVDIFFDKKFFGHAQKWVTTLRDPASIKLFQWLFEYAKKEPPDLTKEMVEASAPFKEFAKVFPLPSLLMDLIVNKMVEDVNTFPDHRKWQYVCDKDRGIGYVSYLTGELSYTLTYGNKTTFLEMLETEKKKMTMDLTDIGPNIRYAVIPLAELPVNFDLRLGLTGSIRCCHQQQKKILSSRRYNIRNVSVIPSLFQSNPSGQDNLVFDERRRNVNLKPTIVEEGEKVEQFFQTLVKVIAEVESHRPILVFMTDERMVEFDKYWDPKEPLKKFVLSKMSNEYDRANCISQAGESDRVTLVARTFGRGIDFISRSNEVQKNGGVHVIQTFLSDSEVEEYQIKGRTGRQGQKGSYQQVLWKTDLVSAFDIKTDFKFADDGYASWEQFITLKRDEKISKSLVEMEEKMESQKQKWEVTKELQNCILNGNRARGMECIASQMQG